MNKKFHKNGDKKDLEREIFFDIPVITTSSPSMDTDSEGSLVCKDMTKLFAETQSDEEFETSFITNNNTVNRRVSFLRSLSPGNLNASNVSRGNVRRWSQSLTNASKSRDNRTINMMPSRMQKLPTALSLDGQLHRIVDSETELEHFVQEIESHEYLLENSATAAQTRNKILRALPQPLHIKRKINAKVMEIVKQKSLRMGTNRWKRGVQFIGLCKTKANTFARNTVRNLKLWNDSMKDIEGHFGASTETFFRFFRFLFILNFLLMSITFTFIVFPQLLEDYIQIKVENYTKPRISSINKMNEEVNWMHLLTAEGVFENSTMFYGAYTNQRIHMCGSFTYSLPFAYLMTMVCVYAVTFIIFSITTAESYRKSFIATSGGEALRAHKLFCSWDFGVSNQRAADMKHQNIFFELQSILNQIYDNVCFQTIWQRICSYALSAVIWIFIVVVLIAIGSSIVYATEISEYFDVYEELSSYIEQNPLLVPTVVVVGLLIFQNLFELLGYLEIKIIRLNRSPRSQLHINLVRNYSLIIVTITSLVWFWLCHTNGKQCWETWIAQNIYRLIVIDFAFVVFLGSLWRSVRFFIYKFVWSGIGVSEFNISRGCLGLIFNQTLLWIGIFFSPPLAAMIVLKMIATFYLKKVVLINFCKAPSKLWRSSQTFTLFLAMMFVSVTIVIVILLFVLTQMNVSSTCGPFRNHIYMFHVLRGDILRLQENHFLWQLIMFLIRPAAIGLLLLTLCGLVYYLRSKSKARIEMVKLLKEMLYIEAKDKEFLLANITRVTQNNEWLLEEFTTHSKEKPLIRPHRRIIERFSESEFPEQSNGKFSFQIGDDSNGSFGKAGKTRRFVNNGRSSFNDLETIRKRRE